MEPAEGARLLPRLRFVALPAFGAGAGAARGGATAPGTERAAGSRIRALDGLRAVAVVAVLLYHAGIPRVRGGFLGVDVFFVLSGYLITGVLAREYIAAGAVALRRFYIRRARRLLPALFTVIAGVCAFVVLWLPGEAEGFRDDATASLLYVTNWWFVGKGQSYFGGTGRPSLLLHLWSLAVEEQFYLVWPMFLLVALGRASHGATVHAERVSALWRAVGWATLLSACSIGLTTLLYSPWHDPSRVYYGADTRAFELLIGVIAALVQIARAEHCELREPRELREPHKPREPHGRVQAVRRIATESASFFTLAAILCAFTLVPANASILYPAGLIALSLAAAVLIRTLVTGTAVAGLLASQPFVWLGERSYALYLWHWPIFDVTRPGTDLAWPPDAVLLLRIGLSVLLAALTYRFIETPVRHGALGRAASRARAALDDRRPAVPVATAGAVLAVVAAAAMLTDTLLVTAAAHPADARAVAVDRGPAAALAGAAQDAAPVPKPQPQPRPHAAAPGEVPAYPTALPPPPAHPPRVALIGDSQGMTLALNSPPDTSAYLTLLDATTEGCGLLGGRISSSAGDRRDLDAECGHTLASWAKRIQRDRADDAVLMIGAWDLFDEKVDGKTLAFGTPDWDAYFTDRLTAAVTALKATGLPRLDLALLPCYRPVRTSGASGGLWPERGDDSRTAHVNSLLSAYAKAPAHHVRALYPPPEFCQDPVISASRAYRWDGVHYYKPGARLYLRTAIPQLLAP
ncbi:acyltransferase family protein [Catenulispora subtropica]